MADYHFDGLSYPLLDANIAKLDKEYKCASKEDQSTWVGRVSFYQDLVDAYHEQAVKIKKLSFHLNDVLEQARCLLNNRSATYKAKNGRGIEIMDDSGERCWIVSDEDCNSLEVALLPVTLETDISPEAVALACMLVSNPGGNLQKPGWRKQVNDTLRAMRERLDQLERKV